MKWPAKVSVDEDAKSVGSVLGSLLRCKLAASISRILLVMFKFKWLVSLDTIWFIDLSILELDESSHIACTGNAGAWRSMLRIAGDIWLNLPTQESSEVRSKGWGY